MAGNSQRRNRRTSNKKGAQVGSGGQRRRGLEGKGPTPPASARKGHKKNRIATAQAKKAAGRRPVARRGGKGTSEMVVGRNPVFEALRDGVPASTLYVQQFIDNDERVREALQLATGRGNINIMEAPRPELDRMTNGLNHQGLVLQVPPYEYAHPEDLAAAAFDDGEDPLIVALDGVTDPRNLGAVVRSVAAFGGHGVVVPERRAAGMTAGAWKTSAGTAARTPSPAPPTSPAPWSRTRRPDSPSSASPPTGTTRSATSRNSAARSSSSSAARARACPASSARPATSSSASRCPAAPNRSTPVSPPVSSSTRPPSAAPDTAFPRFRRDNRPIHQP